KATGLAGAPLSHVTTARCSGPSLGPGRMNITRPAPISSCTTRMCSPYGTPSPSDGTGGAKSTTSVIRMHPPARNAAVVAVPDDLDAAPDVRAAVLDLPQRRQAMAGNLPHEPPADSAVHAGSVQSGHPPPSQVAQFGQPASVRCIGRSGHLLTGPHSVTCRTLRSVRVTGRSCPVARSPACRSSSTTASAWASCDRSLTARSVASSIQQPPHQQGVVSVGFRHCPALDPLACTQPDARARVPGVSQDIQVLGQLLDALP